MDKVWWTNGMRKTLRKRREQLGVTQVEMAKRLKWSQAHFQRHEQGRTDSIDLKVLRKWCAVIDLVANYIPAELEIVTKEHHENMMAIDPAELPQEII